METSGIFSTHYLRQEISFPSLRKQRHLLVKILKRCPPSSTLTYRFPCQQCFGDCKSNFMPQTMINSETHKTKSCRCLINLWESEHQLKNRRHRGSCKTSQGILLDLPEDRKLILRTPYPFPPRVQQADDWYYKYVKAHHDQGENNLPWFLPNDLRQLFFLSIGLTWYGSGVKLWRRIKIGINQIHT